MRRTLLPALLVSLVALALLAPAAAAVPVYSATWNGQSNSGTLTGGTVENVEILVNCPSGETFLGRVSVRANGETYFVGRINGTCTGSPIEVETNQERTSEIPCLVEYTLSGQVRFSGGTKVTIPKYKDKFCSD